MFDSGYDAGLYRARRKRKIRRSMAFVVFILCFAEFIGLPQIRIRPERKPAYYLGLTGAQQKHVTNKSPLIVLAPLKQSLALYAKNAVANAWRMAKAPK